KTHVEPQLGAKTKVIQLSRDDIRSLMETLRDKESAHRSVFTFMRSFCRWLAENDYIAASPMANLKQPKPSIERDRVLTDQELTSIWRAADKIGYPYGHCFQLMILLAQREDEIGGMRWFELNFDSAQWEIPGLRTKTNNPHIVPLHRLALAILQSIPCRAENVFYTRKTKGSKLHGYGKAKNILDLLASNPSMTLREARDLANQHKSKYQHLITSKPWRLHDLRRTAATGMAKLKHHPH